MTLEQITAALRRALDVSEARIAISVPDWIDGTPLLRALDEEEVGEFAKFLRDELVGAP